MARIITEKAFINANIAYPDLLKALLTNPNSWYYDVLGKTREENDASDWSTNDTWYEEVSESEPEY